MMSSCLIFLNELSFANDGGKAPAELTTILIGMIRAVRDVREVRKDLLIAGTVPISRIAIAGGLHSFASLLATADHKEEWRVIKSLDQSSPGDSSWSFTEPNELHDVRFKDQQSFGLLWAHANESVVLSLAVTLSWETNNIVAQLEALTAPGEISSSDITIPNISSSQHVADHRELITRIGKQETSSSVIYENNEFVVRIYFRDHNPPHFHLCSIAQPGTTLARFDIQTLDVLDGCLPSGMERVVRLWAGEQKARLMENWELCSKGQHPFLIPG